MAEGVHRAVAARQIAQEGAVLAAHALTGGNDDVVLFLAQILHPAQEQLLAEGNLRQQDQVRTVAVIALGQARGGGQPARVTAHDLGHGHALQVIHVGIPNDLLHHGGNVLGRAAKAGGVVGEHQVIVDGLGHTDEPDGAADAAAVSCQLGNGVHAVVAADVKHRVDLITLEQAEQGLVHALVLLGGGQLVPAAAQVGGGGALEQLNVQRLAQQLVQIQQLLIQKTLNAVVHAVNAPGTTGAGGFIHARQTGIDYRSGAAALPHQKIHTHQNTLPSSKKAGQPSTPCDTTLFIVSYL